MIRRFILLVLALACWGSAVAQEAKPSFDKAREVWRTVQKRGTPEEREEAVGRLVAAADPRGVEELLAGLRAFGKRIEKLSEDIGAMGLDRRDAWKVVDGLAAKGSPVSAGTEEPARKKDTEISAAQKVLVDELRDLEALAFQLREGAGRLIAGLAPAARTVEIAKLADAVVGAKSPADRSTFVRVLAETHAPESTAALTELLARAEDPAVRVAVIDAFVRRAEVSAVPAIAKALDDDAWTVRATAAKALGSLPTLDGVPALVAAAAKAEGRVLDEIVGSLEDLAGLTRHDNAVLWSEWWTKEGEGLLKIVADARSEDRDARLRGYDAAVERGLLVVARIVLWADGLVPERDADARAPRLRAAALPADPAAEGEKDRRRTAFAQLIQARPKLIRERAVSRLFVAPFRVASVESEDFLTAAEYATYAVGLASAEILSILEPIENGADPADGTNEKAPAVRAVKQARATAYKVLKGQAKAAAAKIRNALKPGAEPFGKPASRPAGPPRPAGEEEIDPRTGKPRPSTTFYGIQTRSKRILYILDVSGSMSDPRARSGDKLPIDVAKEELTQSIRSLPEDAVFNIVFFNHEVAAWKEKPVKADKAGKTEASAWIAARAPAGATNIFDALERGFRLAGRGTHDKQYAVAVDTIFFLSDGQANRGRLVEPAQIVAEVRRLNSEQKLKIHAVGIGKGHDPALMRALAEISGGTYVSK